MHTSCHTIQPRCPTVASSRTTARIPTAASATTASSTASSTAAKSTATPSTPGLSAYTTTSAALLPTTPAIVTTLVSSA